MYLYQQVHIQRANYAQAVRNYDVPYIHLGKKQKNVMSVMVQYPSHINIMYLFYFRIWQLKFWKI